MYREYSFIDELSTPKNWDELAAFTAKKQAQKIAELKEAELLAVQALEAGIRFSTKQRQGSGQICWLSLKIFAGMDRHEL